MNEVGWVVKIGCMGSKSKNHFRGITQTPICPKAIMISETLMLNKLFSCAYVQLDFSLSAACGSTKYNYTKKGGGGILTPRTTLDPLL